MQVSMSNEEFQDAKTKSFNEGKKEGTMETVRVFTASSQVATERVINQLNFEIPGAVTVIDKRQDKASGSNLKCSGESTEERHPKDTTGGMSNH